MCRKGAASAVGVSVSNADALQQRALRMAAQVAVEMNRDRPPAVRLHRCAGRRAVKAADLVAPLSGTKST
jgi:hypothetical protein